MTRGLPGLVLAVAVVAVAPVLGQGLASLPPRPLGDGPFEFDTAEQGRIRVSVMKGLSHPWSLAFLPSGDMLVTERPGRLRLVRNGMLDPQPIGGVPEVYTGGDGGLMDIALHPRFSENQLVYVSYVKPLGEGNHTPALSRGRLEGMSLTDVQEIFVADTAVGGPAAGTPLVFGPDGFLYMGVGGAVDEIAQRLDSHQGKVVRLRDDGRAAPDNPFAGRANAKPEIFTLGHRNMIGLTVHPETGNVWESENGPYGGDEVNVLRPGANYGWPLVSLGRDYSGPKVSERMWREGMVDPEIFWVPSIAVSGMTFYTGDRFPEWRGNLFAGGLRFGRIGGTGQLHRVVFNENGHEIRREALLIELHQRIRNVRQGPDGLLYVLTDEDVGALLTIAPAS